MNKGWERYQKEYETTLERKARAGNLSLNEKEEYQRIRRNKFRNKQMQEGSTISAAGFILIAIIIIGGVYSYYQKTQVNHSKTTIANATNKQVTIEERNRIVSEINRLGTLNNEMFQIVSMALDSYGGNRGSMSDALNDLSSLKIDSEIELLQPIILKQQEVKVVGGILLSYLDETIAVDNGHLQVLINSFNAVNQACSVTVQEVIDRIAIGG